MHNHCTNMKGINANRCYAILLLLVISLPVLAKKVDGYIVNSNGDTLTGYIKVFKFDRKTGVLIVNGIDMECYHQDVVFKAKNDKSFSTYKPEDIVSFGFSYQGRNYTYQRFILESKNIFSKEGNKVYRFLSLEYKGTYSLYRDVVRTNNTANGLMNNLSNLFLDYYLYQTDSGLKKLEGTDEQSLSEILENHGFQEEFIRELPPETKLKDICFVLVKYDQWLKMR